MREFSSRARSTTMLLLASITLVALSGCSGGNTSPLVTAPVITTTSLAPTISTISPTNTQAGRADFTLTINGANFAGASTINFGGAARVTTFVSATQLTAAIPASAVATAGTVGVSVTNPAPGGTSNVVNFTITSGTNAVPVISSFDPIGAPAGAGAFNLWVYGSNFVAGSVVRWNGNDRPTTVIDGNTVEARISASDIATAGTSAVTVFNPAPGGGSSPPSEFVVAAGGVSPVSIAVDPTGKFVYVANFGFADVFVGDVSMYTIDANTGLLTPIGSRVAAEHGPTAVAVHPSGKFVYVADQGDQGGGEDVGDVSMYSIDTTTGALTPAGTVRGFCPSLCAPYGIAVDPSGKFAYVPSEGGFSPTTISMYSINATSGALTSIGTVAAGGRAIAVTVDPSGKFVYVVNGFGGFGGTDNVVSMYTLDASSGDLASIGTIAAGASPSSIAIHPSGKFAYVTNSGSNDLSMYTLDATTGALTFMGLVTAGTTPVSLAVDPLGKFAYAANSGSNDVAMYAIDATSGKLALVGTVAAGTCPVSVAIHPSGKFAYVTNQCSNDISIYSIDGTTGALRLIGTIGT